MNRETRPWYKRKLFIIPAALVVGSIGLASLGSGSSPAPAVENVPAVVSPAQHLVAPTYVPGQEKQTVQTAPTTQSSLSNDNYYTNTDGNQIHSPAYSDSVPPNASAQCKDGSYSFSATRSGTCSHHGGVASWL